MPDQPTTEASPQAQAVGRASIERGAHGRAQPDPGWRRAAPSSISCSALATLCAACGLVPRGRRACRAAARRRRRRRSCLGFRDCHSRLLLHAPLEVESHAGGAERRGDGTSLLDQKPEHTHVIAVNLGRRGPDEHHATHTLHSRAHRRWRSDRQGQRSTFVTLSAHLSETEGRYLIARPTPQVARDKVRRCRLAAH